MYLISAEGYEKAEVGLSIIIIKKKKKLMKFGQK